MRAEHRFLLGQCKVATMTLEGLHNFEIPQIQVAALLNNNPMYHDLQNLARQEPERLRANAVPPGKKPSPAQLQIKADFETTMAQLQNLEQQSRDQIREALRIELQNAVRRLECQKEVSVEQLMAVEKQVERKRDEAYSVGRTSVAAQMARAEVEDVERVLRAVAAERETLRVELNAGNRVRVLGDPSSPAAVPEDPD
jgi:hypothetical protein